MLQTGMRMLIPTFELFAQLDGQPSSKHIISDRRSNPYSHGMIDIGDTFVTTFALLVHRTFVHPLTTRMKYVPSRIHHLGNFQEHLAHVFVDVPTCTNFG